MTRKRCPQCGAVKVMQAHQVCCSRRCAARFVYHRDGRFSRLAPAAAQASKRKADRLWAVRVGDLLRAHGPLPALRAAYQRGYDAGRLARRYEERRTAGPGRQWEAA